MQHDQAQMPIWPKWNRKLSRMSSPVERRECGSFSVIIRDIDPNVKKHTTIMPNSLIIKIQDDGGRHIEFRMSLLLLRELQWLPITERIQYKLCLLVHKMFVEHAPDYIASLLTPASDISSRSSQHSSSNLVVPVPRTSRKTGDRAFSVAAPRARNRLPTDLKLLRRTTSFISKLRSCDCSTRMDCV